MKVTRTRVRKVFVGGLVVAALIVGAGLAPGGPAKALAANAWTLQAIGDMVNHIDSFWLYWNDQVMVEIRDKLNHTKNIQLVELRDEVKGARENAWKSYIQADAATVNAKKAEENAWSSFLHAKSAAEVIGANVVPDLRDLKQRQLDAWEETKKARENGWKAYIQADAATVQGATAVAQAKENFKEIRGQALSLMKVHQDNFKSILDKIDSLNKNPGQPGSVPSNPDRWAEVLMWVSGISGAIEASAGDICRRLPKEGDPPWISLAATAQDVGCTAKSNDIKELAKQRKADSDEQTGKIISAYRELMKGNKDAADRNIEEMREGFGKVVGKFDELIHKYDQANDAGPVIEVPTPAFSRISEWESSLSCFAPSIDVGTDCDGGPTLSIFGAEWRPLNVCGLPDQYQLVKGLIGALIIVGGAWACFRGVLGGFSYTRSE